MPNSHGSHIWYELLTTDPDAAAEFYGAVIGWEVRSAGQEAMDYRLFSAPDADVGGLMKMPAGMPMPPVWLGYVGVDDVDQAVDRLNAAGGAVHMPAMDIEGVGRMAMVADPQGAVFYVMRGASEKDSTAFKPMVEGHCGWNDLATSDQAAAFDFYGKLFGWEKGGAVPMGADGDYVFINHEGGMIGGVLTRKAGKRPIWSYYFCVNGIDAAVERIRSNGGNITFGPTEVPGGAWVIDAVDPQGAAFGLVGSK